MRPIKITILLALLTVVFSCGNNPEKYQEEFSINLNVTEKVIPNNQTVQLSLNNPKNRTISSTYYSINGKDISESLDLSTVKLGKQTIEAVVKFDETSVSITKDITIVSSEIPKIYTFKVLNEYPHDPSSYTQGLEFHNGTLYEGTGQRGASKLRKINYQTGDVLQDVDIAKEYEKIIEGAHEEKLSKLLPKLDQVKDGKVWDFFVINQSMKGFHCDRFGKYSSQSLCV